MEEDADLPGPLLGPDEPPAVEWVNPAGGGHAVLVCDHASNRIPACLGALGLKPDMLQAHVAWDPGAAAVARRLAAELDAPLLLAGYSRLVIDCNRPLDHADSMAERSAGIPVPGNRGLSLSARSRRVDALFRPYHAAIAELLDARAARRTALLSIHSFSPVLNGEERPWQIGISHWQDRRLADLLLGALGRVGSFALGDNAPYPIEADIDYTIPVHAGARGLPAVMVEIRQDELRTPAGVAAWAARLAAAYRLIEGEIPQLCGQPLGDAPAGRPR